MKTAAAFFTAAILAAACGGAVDNDDNDPPGEDTPSAEALALDGSWGRHINDYCTHNFHVDAWAGTYEWHYVCYEPGADRFTDEAESGVLVVNGNFAEMTPTHASCAGVDNAYVVPQTSAAPFSTATGDLIFAVEDGTVRFMRGETAPDGQLSFLIPRAARGMRLGSVYGCWTEDGAFEPHSVRAL